MSTTLNTNTDNAICLTNTKETSDFSRYINTCRSQNDTNKASNLINTEIIQNINDTFDKLKAEYTDLITMGDKVADISDLNGNSMESVNGRIQALNERKNKLEEEISYYNNLSSKADKTFLEDIFYGTPQQESLLSLQDVALFTFWFGWLILGVCLVAIRWGSPQGSFIGALFVLGLYTLVSLTIYGLLQRFA